MERISEFCDLPQEAPEEIPETKPDGWPDKGEVCATDQAFVSVSSCRGLHAPQACICRAPSLPGPEALLQLKQGRLSETMKPSDKRRATKQGLLVLSGRTAQKPHIPA